MYRAIVCLVILLLCNSNYGQLGKVSGVVSDEFGPLSGAKVRVVGTDLAVNCDINGAYSFDLKAGTYEIEAGYLLFGTQIKPATISFNSLNVIVDFVLKSGSAVDANTSIGSRSKPKTQMENAVAVDIISAQDISNSGQLSLTGVLHYFVPSFHSTAQTISDGTDHIAPATLRGLGPDQLLVLVNGKRWHSSSLVNVNGTVGRGSVGVDFNAIPLTAIDRVEILRDGAAAQYGSDAIAGVINIILKDRSNVFSLNSVIQPTLQGDGLEKMIGVNYGVELGNGGFLNVSGELRSKDAVNRAGDYNGNVYSANDSLDQVLIEENDFYGQLSDYDDKQIMQIGSAKTQDGSAFFNMVVPAKKSEVYANGGVNYRNGEGRGFYRLPISTTRVVQEHYPNGFSPEIHTEIVDKTMTLGVRGNRNGWDIDFNNSTGSNSIDFTVKNSNNASLGVASPTNSFAGGFLYKQNSTQINFSKNIKKLWFLDNTNFSFGGEYRVEKYQIVSGESASWEDGGDTNALGEKYEAGMQVFPGFQPQNALKKGRSNFATYVDVEFHFSEAFLLNAAARFENYDFFGSNITGKVASRYKITKNLSLRGSYSTGFRAPSLHQIYFNNLSTQFIDGNALQVGTFNNESPIAQALGIGTLQPESSTNLSFGLSGKAFENFTISGDAYFIAIQDRIVLSGGISDGFETILEPVGASSAQFFTNAVNTQTLGFDIVATHSVKISNGVLKISGAFNRSSTKLNGGINTSSILQGAEDELFNREEISRLEVAQPQNKAILSTGYSVKKWNFYLKNTRFGSVQYIHPNDGDQANWVFNEYSQKVESRDQVFKAKVITDVIVSYRFSNYFTLAFGGNNILNIYPDAHKHSANTSSGNFKYSRRVQQFGVTGASYFARLNFSF